MASKTACRGIAVTAFRCHCMVSGAAGSPAKRGSVRPASVSAKSRMPTSARASGRHGAAVGIRQKLAAEADAEHRHALRHGIPQQRLLRPEPGMEVLLVRLLRPAHGEHGVVVLERRKGLALPGVARLPGDAYRRHDLAEEAGLVDLRMPDDQHPAGAAMPYQSRSEVLWQRPSASVPSLA